MTANDLRGMKLSKALPLLKCNIKLGCQSGSGFVYCGKLKGKKLFRMLDLFDTKYKKKQIAYIEKLERNLEKQLDEMQALLKKIDLTSKTLNERRAALDKRKHFLRRKILDAYKSISEENTVILLMEGDETGEYWTSDECEIGEDI